jgi:cytochrome o ubiquinol oxidase subunit 2
MNSFFVPALAGQIYAMPSMATSLHAVINRPGEYEGFSANYSGAGFSDMRFKFLGVGAGDFDRWLQKAKASKDELSRGSYMQLEQPSERDPVRRYSAVAPDLFDAIVNRCVDQGKMCLREMMAMDAQRPSGRESAQEPIALNLDLDAPLCRADNSAAGALLPSVYRD